MLLAIDQGTSATKAVLVDADGRSSLARRPPVGQSHPQPGWVEQSADEIWDSVRAAVADCLGAHDAAAVAAVGLSTQRESLVLWERGSGDAVGPLLSWQDQRTAPHCARLRREGAGDRVRALSGLPLDPMFSAPKARLAARRARSRPRAQPRGELCLGTVDSWLLSRLGGEHVIEVGNASRTQLLDVRRCRWDPELLELFGVPESVLPSVVASTGPFPAVRGLPPLPDGIPVLAVMGDSHAALFAHAGWRPGQVKATYGTGSSIMSLGRVPDQRIGGAVPDDRVGRRDARARRRGQHPRQRRHADVAGRAAGAPRRRRWPSARRRAARASTSYRRSAASARRGGTTRRSG